MKFEWDENKRLSNLQKHSIDFGDAPLLFNDEAIIVEDRRKNYGEKRYRLINFLRAELVILIFTRRNDTVRVISLRKANKRERETYVQDRFQAPN